MSLRNQALLITTVMLACLLGVLLWVSHALFLRGFARIEEDEIRLDLAAARSALAHEQAALVALASDWASWGAVRPGADHRPVEALAAQLDVSALERSRVDALRLWTKPGVTAHSVFRDPTGDSAERWRGVLAEAAARNASGLFLMDHGPALVAVQPVQDAEGRSTLAIGRDLDEDELGILSRMTRQSLAAEPWDRPATSDFLSARSLLTIEAENPAVPEIAVVRPLGADRIAGYGLIRDAAGRPALILRVDSRRTIYHQGQILVYGFLALILVAGMLITVVTLSLLERHVLARLSGLAEQISRMGQRRDLSVRLPAGRDDELSRLASAVNRMLADLESSQREREQIQVRLQQTHQLRAMGTLAAGVAHEINNPLNNLRLALSGLDMLLDRNATVDPSSFRQRLQPALAEITRIEEIVRHMRRLVSRPEETRLSEPVSVARVVEQALGLMNAQFAAHDIRVQVEMAAELPAVRADARQLEQALIHLLANAMQALDRAAPSEPRVRISAKPDAGRVILEVADNGPGLGQDPNRVFEPFHSTQAEGAGMGLGLAIVHSHAAAWGADIRAGGSAEGGALFTIALRVFPRENEGSATSARPEA